MEATLSAAPRAAAKGATFTLDQNSPMLRVLLEHKGKSAGALAVLDTGAQDIYVPRPIAEHLGFDLNKIPKGTLFGGVKGAKTTYPIIFDKLTLRDSPNCSAGPIMARTAAFDPMGGYLLLGRPFIRAIGMKIVFEKFKDTYRLFCSRAGKMAHTIKESIDSVRFDNPKKMFRQFSLTYGPNTLTGPCYVDTGATHTLLPLWLGEQLGMKPRALAGRAQGAAGSFTILLGELDKIALEGTPCRTGPLRILLSPHARYPIVGVDFFKSTGMVIDFAKDTPKIHCGG